MDGLTSDGCKCCLVFLNEPVEEGKSAYIYNYWNSPETTLSMFFFVAKLRPHTWNYQYDVAGKRWMKLCGDRFYVNTVDPLNNTRQFVYFECISGRQKKN